MNDARAVVGMDRLPWLMDEPKPRARAKTGGRELFGWALAALFVVAGISYWLGTRVVRPPVESSLPAEPQATVKLPEASEAIQPQEQAVEAPEAAPAIVPERPAARPAHHRRAGPVRRRRTLSPMEMSGSDLSKTVAQQEHKAETPKPLASKEQLRLWPAQQSQGADGRIVRIGAFGTRDQAKLGWRRMQRAYPAVGRLPATVVTDRNSHGRVFYRFQIGTTSQAHSEVLCQRMEKLLRFSCAVVGLPWKAKVER